MGQGRRMRVRTRVRASGLIDFTQLEMLEFLLYPYLPRKDTVPLATSLLNQFGSLDNILRTRTDILERVPGMPKLAALSLPQLRFIVHVAESDSVLACKTLDNPENAAFYLNALIGHEKNERALAIFLDAHQSVICSKQLKIGSSDNVDLQIKDLATLALNLNASSVIFSHNHPSGSLAPSSDDLATTTAIYNALNALGIKLADHIIVGWDKFCSLARSNMLDGRDTPLADKTDSYFVKTLNHKTTSQNENTSASIHELPVNHYQHILPRNDVEEIAPEEIILRPIKK